jgi:alkylation response protein AidB-like acyl-CoA dehydrogenase
MYPLAIGPHAPNRTLRKQGVHMFDTPFPLDALRDTVRAFAAAEIAPRAAEIDRTTVPARPVAEDGRARRAGITVPEQYGGAGLGYLRTWRRWRRSAAPRPRSA